jgi:hypothetical protein
MDLEECCLTKWAFPSHSSQKAVDHAPVADVRILESLKCFLKINYPLIYLQSCPQHLVGEGKHRGKRLGSGREAEVVGGCLKKFCG